MPVLRMVDGFELAVDAQFIPQLRSAVLAELTELSSGNAYPQTALPDSSDLMLRKALAEAVALRNANFGNIQIYDRDARTLRIAAQQGFRREFLEYFRTVGVEEGSACARALAQRRPITIADVEQDPDFAAHREIAARAGFRRVESRPLVADDGLLLGVLSVHFRHADALDMLLRELGRHDGVARVLVGASGTIMQLNRSAELLFGFERYELTDRPLSILIPSRFRAQHAALQQEFNRDPVPRPMGVGRHLYGLHKDGREIAVEIALTPAETEVGTFTLVAVVPVDPHRSP